MGTADTTRSSLRSIKKDYTAPGAAVRDPGVQVAFQHSSQSKEGGLKEPFESGKSTNGYKTGATARSSIT